MKISEVFKSCQGEGASAGLPTIFVRLSGCNLYPKSCRWCDTKYAQKCDGRGMSVEEVVTSVEELTSGQRRVCITGGEPLHQQSELLSLVGYLRFRKYFVEVFTNSTLLPPAWFFLVDSWIVDVKCPSSSVADKCLVESWMSVVREKDLVKFVVANQTDLDYVESVLKEFSTHAPVALSPMVPTSGLLTPGALVLQRKWMQVVWNFCVENDYRFSLQVHKTVFGNKRGV